MAAQVWAIADCGVTWAVTLLVAPAVTGRDLLVEPDTVLIAASLLSLALRPVIFLSVWAGKDKGNADATNFGQFVGGVLSSFIFGTIIIHVLIVLFGAPVFELWKRTWSISMLLSTLTFVPTTFSSHGRRMGLREILSSTIDFFVRGECKDEADQALLLQARLCAFGAWFGAIPIPLDWDRPWQTWPVTLAYGSLAGNFLGSLLVMGMLLPTIESLIFPKEVKKSD